jgi:RES domain-containing protein
MIVYRITRSLHRELDGEGAQQSGGRWNSPGTAVVYASSTRALAALEYLVHIDVDEVPDDLVLMSVEVPDELLVENVADDVSGSNAERAAGDAWASGGRTIALGVPSRLIPEEWNYLINPRHRSTGELRVVNVRGFVFDERLM